MPIFEALKQYHEKEVIPFDVPGHKHGKGIPELADFLGEKVLQVDVNSMKPLDFLNDPTSVIKDAQELAANAFSADHCFFLVNGTTSAVQAMIMSTCNPGEKLILPRNAHKSAIHGLILSGAQPVYIQPEINNQLGIAMGVSVESVEIAIAENPDARAVFIINPTYYGYTSKIKEIVKLAHRHGMAVIVDEAHGAHFGFSTELPQDAMSAGADMSAVSLHKTGGSLTQSSLLLMREGLIDSGIVRTMINLTQTTSASYLLMTSLDVARKGLATKGSETLGRVLEISREARDRINSIKGLYAFGKELLDDKGVHSFDETKLGVNVTGIGLTGFEAYDILRDEYNIQVELGDTGNILAVISLGDDSSSVDSLVSALEDMAKRLKKEQLKIKVPPLKNPEVIVSPRNAFYSMKRSVRLEDAKGMICAESVMVYPPGIPIVTMGEKISEEIIEYINFVKSQKTTISGTRDPNVEYIEVLGY